MAYNAMLHSSSRHLAWQIGPRQPVVSSCHANPGSSPLPIAGTPRPIGLAEACCKRQRLVLTPWSAGNKMQDNNESKAAPQRPIPDLRQPEQTQSGNSSSMPDLSAAATQADTIQPASIPRTADNEVSASSFQSVQNGTQKHRPPVHSSSHRQQPNYTTRPLPRSNSNGSGNGTSYAASPQPASTLQSQQQLLKQLLQLSSMSSTSSLDTVDAEELAASSNAQKPTTAVHNTRGSTSKVEQNTGGLYDDESAVDYDPMMLDMLGFSSVAQYLQFKFDQAMKQAKVSALAAVMWGTIAIVCLAPLGGPSAYSRLMVALTQDNAAADNLTFLWAGVLTHYIVKGCVMSLATGMRSWLAKTKEADLLQELEQVEKSKQRLAFWQLQDRMSRLEDRANRTYTEFTLASMLLGLLLLMRGGPDNMQLQLETVDQSVLSELLVLVWLFWESYFASIVALVHIIQLVTAWLEKWTHQQRWQKRHDKK